MNKPLIPDDKVDLTSLAREDLVVPSLERRRMRAFIAMLFGDMAILLMAFATAGLIYEGEWWQDRAVLGAQLLTPLFLTISFYNNAYSARVLVNLRYAARKVAMSLLIAAALLNFIAFYLKANAEFSRVVFTLGLAFSLPMLIAFRWAVMRTVKNLWQGRVRNELILHAGGPSFALEHARAFDTRQMGLDPESKDPYMLDRLGKLLQNQDKVVVSCPRDERGAWAFLLKSAGVSGEIVSEPAHELGALGVNRYEGQERTTLIVSTGPLGLRARITKRAFDTAVATIGLVCLTPLILLVAIAIKVEDGGPVFFVQRRMGRGNRFFNLLKFRSMGAEKLDPSGGESTARDDARVTKVGRFIRTTSIDELPQLLNVLRGEMSLVGPRPHALGSRANAKLFWEVDNRYWRRHSLRPGLTGLAQVRGLRGSTDHEVDLTDRLQADLEYIKDWSLKRDIGIMLQTLSVLRHDRAY